LGAAGDFITAPEVSPLFGACLAQSIQPVLVELAASGPGPAELLEFGAGSGALAVDVLERLERLDCLPAVYNILELSAELRRRQQDRISRLPADLRRRVRWLDRLPASDWRGVVLANELLDAMPVHRFRIGEGGELEEQFVAEHKGRLRPLWSVPVSPGLAEALAQLQSDPPSGIGPLPVGYESEINLRLGPWLRALGESIAQGAVLLIDYGYTQREYYLAERRRGTLICHYRHRAHADPFILPGLQDITANVDFTAVAEAGEHAGFDLAGFTTQAHFLMASGLDRLVGESDPGDMVEHLKLVQGVKTLTLPSEMGERFKVIALSKGVERRPGGFELRDLSDRL
jgi:SAM-dependent MidA family methyltransferase